ncbi:unnamed protein product, partial [Brassica oleracea var. botrytis]
ISNYKKVSLGPIDRSFSKNTLEILQTKVCFSVSGKHIRSALSRRHGSVKQNSATIPEYSKAEGGGVVLDTSFGDEFGRAHFGYTPTVKFKKVVWREMKILRALSGHDNLPHFYDAYEDH